MSKIFVYGDRSVFRNYADALDGCGARSVFSENLEYAKDCGALLLPGGGDVDPVRYGRENTASSGIDPKRDRAELELIREFSVTRRPILGICRGLQILNVAFGGTLCQDLPTAPAHRWDEAGGDRVHRVRVPAGSFLAPLYGDDFPVNSSHHQGAQGPAPGLTVSAEAEDGVIEAVEDREKRIYAVQWHPERMAFRKSRPDTVDGRILFDFFLSLI